MAVLEVACPGCQAALKAPDTMVGKKVKCKKCGVAFRVPGGAPTGDTSGDAEFLSAIDLPAPAPEPAGNPFDFSAPAAPAAPPAPKKSAAVPKPAPKAAPAAPPAVRSPAAKPPARAAGPVAAAEDDVPLAAPVDDETLAADPGPPEAADKKTKAKSAAVVKTPAAPANPFAFDTEPAAPAGSGEPVATDRPRPTGPAVEKTKAKPAPVAKAPAAPADPFAFETDPAPPAAPTGEKSKGKPAPATKSQPASADPFAFEAEPEPAPAADPAEDAPTESPAPAEAAPASPRRRRSDDLAKIAKLSSRPPRAVKKDGGRGVGTLVLVVGVFGLVAGGVVGAVLLYLNQKKDGEQARVEKKDDKKEAEAPPPADPAPKKNEPKEAVGAAPKDAARSPTVRAAAARTKGAAAQAGPLALPAGVRPIQFLPEAAKREMIREPAATLPINAALGPKADSAFAKVRRVFPPLKRDIDPAVLWQTEAGFQGRGEKLLLGIYSPQTGKQENTVEVDGDGTPNPVCDLSVAANEFAHAHTADGKVTIWNTRQGKKLVDGFAPYADKPGLKDAKIAAVYLTEPPDRFVTVSTTGAVHVFEVATKAPVGEFTPPKPPPSPLAAGKSVTPGPGRVSVVMLVGGVLYRVKVREAVAGEAVGDLGGDFGRALGLAASGDGKLVCVFETGGEKKEKAVMSVRPDDKHQVYRWPDEAGDPVSVGWCGEQMAAVGTARGAAVWFAAEGESFRPLALVRTPGDKGVHVASDDYWSLLPDPADPKKCVLVAFASPQQAFESVLEGTPKKPPTVRLDEKGLFK